MKMASTPVLVLGMHRSGTSYLASILAALGVKMGDELLAADAGNPRGYFENLSVLAFHKALLARRSKPSQTRADFLPGPDFSPAWSAEESAQADALVALLAREGFWGWKEPRTCLFLAQWMEKLPQARCIAVYRHPLEIYYSFLKRRDWSALFSPESVFEAAAIYNDAIFAARALTPERFLILHAGASFADAPALAELVAGFLGIDLPEQGLELPQFAAGEFSSLGIVREQHALMALAYPRAAKAYERMQSVAERSAEFAGDACQTPVPADEIARVVSALESARKGAGQAYVDAFCLNVPAAVIRDLREAIAAGVDGQINAISADRDRYIVNFEKYKALYENYIEAWKGTDRTLAETRDWISRDLQPKIERFEARLREHNLPTD
jgi:hypothetical protein